MNVRQPFSVPAFLHQQRWRFILLVATALIAAAGLYWLSLMHRQFYVGSSSPSGKQFVTYTYDDSGRSSYVAAHVRDAASGKVIHDLTGNGTSWGEFVAWIDDMTVVALAEDADGRYHAVTLRLTPQLTVIRDKIISDRRVRVVQCSGEGQFIYPIASNEQRPRFIKIYKAPILNVGAFDQAKVIAHFDLGDDEEAYAHRPSTSPQGIVCIEVYPRGSGLPSDDFVYTDGKNLTTILVDAESGKVLRTLRGGYQFMPNSTEFVWLEKKPAMDVYHIDDLENPIASFTPKHGGIIALVETNADRHVFVERGCRTDCDFVTVKSRVTGERREFQMPVWSSYQLARDGNLHVAAGGKLMRLDLASGKSIRLANARYGYELSRAIALGGVPLLMLCSLIGIVRSKVPAPFFDMGLVCVLLAVIFIAWGQAETISKSLLLSLTQTFLGAALAVGLVWVSTSRSLFGKGIPLAVVTVAAFVVLYMWSWPKNGGAMVEIVFGGAMLIFFQSVGHIVFRKMFGRIHRATDAMPLPQKQFSVRQIAVTTAAVALLFACLRFVEFSGTNFGGKVILWMVCFSAAYGASVMGAMWAAFQVQNTVLSAAATLLGWVVCVGGLVVVNQSIGLHNINGQDAVQAYAQPLIVSAIVWLTLRICGRSGYSLLTHFA